MSQLFSNYAQSTLYAAIDNDDTTFSVIPTEGGMFASPTDNNYQLVTLTDGFYWEVVKVTGRSGDVFTVERAYEGIARSWAEGTYVKAQVTKATMENLLQQDRVGSISLYLYQNFR